MRARACASVRACERACLRARVMAGGQGGRQCVRARVCACHSSFNGRPLLGQIYARRVPVRAVRNFTVPAQIVKVKRLIRRSVYFLKILNRGSISFKKHEMVFLIRHQYLQENMNGRFGNMGLVIWNQYLQENMKWAFGNFN